ncbi:MAG: hypothetical protein ACK4NY_15605 [Spirosomataceae bacterium]
MKHDIYCDYEFLEEFINQLKGKDLIEYLNSADDYGVDLFRLFFNGSKIELNKSNEEIIQLSKINPYINKLLKSGSLKESKIDVLDLDFEKISPNMPFFLEKPQIETEKLIEKYGMWFFSKDRMSNVRQLFKLQSHNFTSRNNFKNFDFFQKYQHPCNALILTDDYFFTIKKGNDKIYDENAIEKNLKPILKRILPKKLGIDFQLTIILSPNDTNIDFNKIKSAIEDTTSLYEYPVKINFIKSNFHERHIFTNYYKITADKGFKNLVKDVRNDTFKWDHPKNSFEFRSIFYSITKDEDYLEKIAECKDRDEKGSKVGDSFKNRLLQ